MADVAIETGTLLQMRDVEVCFSLKRSGFFAKPPLLRAVDGV